MKYWVKNEICIHVFSSQMQENGEEKISLDTKVPEATDEDQTKETAES